MIDRDALGRGVISMCEKHGAYTGERCPACGPQEEEREPKGGTTVIGGLDLAKLHDYSAMVDLSIDFHAAKVRGIKSWPHVDYSVVTRDAAGRYAKTGMAILGVDASGVGEPISEMLWALGVRTQDIKFGEYVDWTNPFGNVEHAPIKYAMVEYARACLQDGLVKFPSRGAEELMTQLREQEMSVGPTDRPKYAHPEGRHDDLAWAFMIALYVSRPWLTGSGLFAVSATAPKGRGENYYAQWEARR